MKISKIILPAILLLIINKCMAQNDSSASTEYDRFYISLTGGIGFPSGSFVRYEGFFPDEFYLTGKIVNSNLAGEARPGVTGKLNGNYFFSRHFGCMASVFTGSFKAKDKTLNELDTRDLSYYPFPFTYNTKSWKVSGLMIGVTGCLYVSKFSFSIKFLGGLQRSICPQTDFSLTQYFNSIYESHWTQPSVSSSGFGWGSGLDIKIHAHRKIKIILSADYISGKADFKGKLRLDTEKRDLFGGIYNDSRSFPFELTKQISFFSLNGGIAYVFK